MPIKLQNCLFLIGSSFVGQILFIFIGLFILLPLNVKEWIFYLILDNIFPITLLLSAINLCSNKVAQYIYTRSKKYLPRLQWYSMFFAWAVLVDKYLKIQDFGIFTAISISCIVGALCNKKRTWEHRFTSVFLFAILLFLSYLIEYTSFKDF